MAKDHHALERKAIELINLGKFEDAEAVYQEVINMGSTAASVYCNLAAICTMQGRFGEAVPLLQTAIQIQHDFPDAHLNLGLALKKQGDLAGAIASYNTALRLDPNLPDGHNNLGVAFKERGDLKAAMEAYRRAVQLNPNYPEAHLNLGVGLQEQGNLEEATAAYHKALAVNPSFPDAHYNLGIVLQAQGNLNAAVASFHRALKHNPHHAEALTSVAMAELLLGNYETGWPRYEHRFKTPSGKTILNAQPQCPRWQGEKITPESQLTVVGEQGLGDTLQFMRYVIALREQGMPVALCADPKLHGLIQASGIDPAPLTPQQANAVCGGRWIPLLSVPRHLGVSPENPLISEPYIHAPEELISKWRQILAAEQRPIIGLNWQGNPSHESTTSIGRSLPLEALAPLARLEGVRFVSLQKGAGSEQLEGCSFRDRFVSCQPQISATWDFLETAAIIAACDLVITSDTAVAHLAGGMGKATWLLLKQVPEWRWGLEGERSFWYPSMRLFRQRQRGDWDALLQRVTDELLDQMAGTTGHQLDLPSIQCFCISLPDAGERRQSMLELKGRLHLNLEFVDAIDGRTASRDQIQAATELEIEWCGLKGHRDAIRLPTEAACSISHIQVWKRILEEGLDHAIVLEDDVWVGHLAPLFIPADADLVYLSNRVNRNSHGEAAAPLCGAEAYYITSQCCRKLLRIYWRITMPVDIQWLPQFKSLIQSGHFLTEFTDHNLPILQAYAIPGVFRLNEHAITSQIRTSQQTSNQPLLAPISLGELIDKITILELKAQHVRGSALDNVSRELAELETVLAGQDVRVEAALIGQLREVNQSLWQIEDAIREQERQQSFGDDFIALARAVYQQNDQRAAIKKEINLRFGSALVEEKVYGSETSGSVVLPNQSAGVEMQNSEPAIDRGCSGEAEAAETHEQDALEHRALALLKEGKLQQADAVYQQLIADGAPNHRVYGNLAALCGLQSRWDETIAFCRAAIQLEPNYPDAHNNLGNALKEQGDLETAIGCYERALQLNSNYPQAHFNLAMALLLVGDYRRGWEHYEHRFQSPCCQGILHAQPQCPRWDGQPLPPQERLLLVGEQGLGDTLQFMRYARALRERGMAISLCTYPKLHGLIQASGIDATPLTPQQANAVREGRWIPLLSLPRHLGVRPDHPVITGPYIRCSEALIGRWKENLAEETGLIIGLNWQGNPAIEMSMFSGRSLPLEALAPLARDPRVRLLSLQKGPGSEQLEHCSFRHRFVGCQPQISNTWDFVETAAILANCDLVISSDTAVAHLAAGMDKPTWLLLKQVPEWRWGLAGESTFWYPSMRLFRQSRRDDWAELLERVTAALAELLGAP